MHGATGVCCFVRHIQKFTVMLIKTAETHSLWSIQPFLFKLIYRVIRSAALNHKKLLLFKKKCHLLSSLCSVFHHRLTSEAARLLATMLYSLSEKLFAIMFWREVKLFSMGRAFQSSGLDAGNVLLSYHLILVLVASRYIHFADFSLLSSSFKGIWLNQKNECCN